MDRENKISCVLQWLSEEGYNQTLKTLEEETRQTYCDSDCGRGSMLQEALDAYHELILSMDNPLPVSVISADASFAEPGDGRIPNTLSKKFEKMHDGGLLSVAVNTRGDLLSTTSTDKSIKLWKLSEGADDVEEAGSIICNGPVLSIDFSVNGELRRDEDEGIKTPADEIGWVSVGMHVSRIIPAHRKYVVRVKWHPQGTMFATASYDHSAKLFKINNGNPELVKQFVFPSNVEAIDFTPDGKYLVLARREFNYLVYVDTETLEQTLYNMNTNGDDHVSFSAMDLRFSPDGKLLLVSTDRDRVIVMETRSEIQHRNLYGAQNDSFGTPRAVWHPSGKYIYSTSQNNTICAWDVITQKLSAELVGHEGLPRDLVIHPKTNMLYSVSFDRKMISWKFVGADYN